MNLNIEKIKPYPGKVFGRIIEGDYVSKGGIHVVTSTKTKKPEKVLVVSVGAPFKNEKDKFQEYYARVGDTAYFKKASGKKITINQKRYLFLDNCDIIATQ